MKNILSQPQIDRIRKQCRKMKINQYTINNNGSIDAHQDVDLYFDHTGEFPIKFNKIFGDFSCDRNEMTTLENGPVFVSGNFNCSNNKLTSLAFAPKIVQGDFDCTSNLITSLKSNLKEVGGNFDCSSNKLKSLRYSLKEINGFFACSNNEITSLKNGPVTIGSAFFCDDNFLKNLEGAPEKIGREFVCTGNKLTTLMDMPVNSVDYLFYGNPLPDYLLDTCARLNYEEVGVFIKYQNHYDVWTPEFNQEKFDELIAEIQDGLR